MQATVAKFLLFASILKFQQSIYNYNFQFNFINFQNNALHTTYGSSRSGPLPMHAIGFSSSYGKAYFM